MNKQLGKKKNRQYSCRVGLFFSQITPCFLSTDSNTVISLNWARDIKNIRAWWGIYCSTSEERSDSRVLQYIPIHKRIFLISLNQFNDVYNICFLLYNFIYQYHHAWRYWILVLPISPHVTKLDIQYHHTWRYWILVLLISPRVMILIYEVI